MDNLPQEQPSVSVPAQVAAQPVVPVVPGRRWYHSKKVWSVAVVLLILLGILSFVPAGKIPFLRQLMYAMGYSYEEGQKTSFLKALLSWNEHRKILNGEIPDPNEMSVFGTDAGAFNSATNKAQNKLIDINSVNAALAKSGKKGDKLAGAYYDPAQDAARANGAASEDDATVRIGNKDATANTQANNAKNADVFFGEDSSLIARDKKDGYNSVNTLKKVAIKPIAGSSGMDWLGRTIDKAVRNDTDLTDFSKALDNSGTALAQIGNVAKVGDSRAKRDMYWAWLMGRAARRTPQTLLKKTLASASFDGAEMPRSVFTASGFSGVGIRADDVLADMDSVQQYLDQDKNCQEAINQGMGMANDEELASQIQGLAGSFPANCEAVEDGGGTYMGTLTSISNTCKNMKTAYEQIQNRCSTLSLVNDSQCESVKLASYYEDFATMCAAEKQKCEEMPDDSEESAQAKAQCFADWGGISSNESHEGYPWDSDDLAGEVQTTFYKNNRLNTDYFPGFDWGSGLWLDGDIAK